MHLKLIKISLRELLVIFVFITFYRSTNCNVKTQIIQIDIYTDVINLTNSSFNLISFTQVIYITFCITIKWTKIH